jgi:outer membrane protein
MESTMKKCLFFTTTIALILFFHAVVFGQELTRVGLIDLQRCLQESVEGKRTTGVLKRKKDELQKQLDTKQQELFELRREFEKQSMMLSMDAQENKRRAVERKTRELEYYLQDLNEEMARAQEREKKRIFEELGEVIERIGSDGGYAIILEKRAGGVLYWNKAIDITDQVIKAYDKLKQGQS